MSDDEDFEESCAAGGGSRAPPDLAPAAVGPSHEVAGSSRRDENPFSLRHFLRGGGGGGGTGYECSGARPKRYACPPASPERPRAAPAPLVLPDFVQDHLPVESPAQPHPLRLDLTESVPRLLPPRHSFLLDLAHQPAGGGELPDCLPPRPARASPDRAQLHTLLLSTRSELRESRARAERLEEEAEGLRAELNRARHTCVACGGARHPGDGEELERLRVETRQLRESESAWRQQAEAGAARAAAAGRRLRQASDHADNALREVLQELRAADAALQSA